MVFVFVCRYIDKQLASECSALPPAAAATAATACSASIHPTSTSQQAFWPCASSLLVSHTPPFYPPSLRACSSPSLSQAERQSSGDGRAARLRSVHEPGARGHRRDRERGGAKPDRHVRAQRKQRAHDRVPGEAVRRLALRHTAPSPTDPHERPARRHIVREDVTSHHRVYSVQSARIVFTTPPQLLAEPSWGLELAGCCSCKRCDRECRSRSLWAGLCNGSDPLYTATHSM